MHNHKDEAWYNRYGARINPVMPYATNARQTSIKIQSFRFRDFWLLVNGGVVEVGQKFYQCPIFDSDKERQIGEILILFYVSYTHNYMY